jgi:ribosome-associated protein
MDIRKLQRAIVDGLEDVKASNILVFNTEHLSPLFERVIIASGTSNRQTKSLAASVRDAVKSKGFPVPRMEGEGNGEWIIVDCGAAVAHIMQPAIRDYYQLEEIWGEKPVKLKMASKSGGLVKASGSDEDEDDGEAPRAAPRKSSSGSRAKASSAAKPAGAKTAAAKKPAAKRAKPGAKSSGAGASRLSSREIALNGPASRSPAKPAAKPAARKTARSAASGAVTRTVGTRGGAVVSTTGAAPRKSASAATRTARSGTAGAKTASRSAKPASGAPAKTASRKPRTPRA